jgi:hypothetical protein
MLCEGPLASVLPNDSAHIACSPWQVAIVVPFRMLESTLGYWDPASADWRICPTSFGPRQRAGDGRLGGGALRLARPVAEDHWERWERRCRQGNSLPAGSVGTDSPGRAVRRGQPAKPSSAQVAPGMNHRGWASPVSSRP